MADVAAAGKSEEAKQSYTRQANNDRARHGDPTGLLEDPKSEYPYPDRGLAGRVMVFFGGRPPRLIPFVDPGYARLEYE